MATYLHQQFLNTWRSPFSCKCTGLLRVQKKTWCQHFCWSWRNVTL